MANCLSVLLHGTDEVRASIVFFVTADCTDNLSKKSIQSAYTGILTLYIEIARCFPVKDVDKNRPLISGLSGSIIKNSVSKRQETDHENSNYCTHPLIMGIQKKLLDAIAAAYEVDLIDAVKVRKGFEPIRQDQFASSIYYSKFHQAHNLRQPGHVPE